MVISECGLSSPIRPSTVQIHPLPETTPSRGPFMSLNPLTASHPSPRSPMEPIDLVPWPPVMSPIVALIKTPPIGSSERYVKVAGNREEVTQCIYHICCALLDSPIKGETRLYRPDTGFQNEVRGPRSRGSDRDRGRDDTDRMRGYAEMSGRRDDRGRSPPAAYSYAHQGGAYSSPFDAIADFARRSTGGGGGRSRRDDSRDRDLRHEMSVPNDVVGSVIGKRGSKINEIRQISGATINIMESGQKRRERSPEPGPLDRERIIEISGSTEAVALAKSLINMAMDLGRAGYNDDMRGGRDYRRDGGRGEERRGGHRTRSRSRDRAAGGYGGERRSDRRDKFAPY